MKVFIPLFVLLLATSTLVGELHFPDELDKAWNAVANNLNEGGNRSEIAADLESAASENRTSRSYQDAMALAEALRKSDRQLRGIKKVGVSVVIAPWAWLADSHMDLSMLAHHENAAWMHHYFAEHPQDPACILIRQGRESIGSLLPVLLDMAPTRGDLGFFLDGHKFQRTSDLALAIVEYLSGCSFCEDMFSQGQFSMLPEATRLRTLREAEAWWKEYGQAGLSEGIRARFPHAGLHGKVRMARRLAETGVVADRAFARDELRSLIYLFYGHGSSEVAIALWDMGDCYAMDAAHRRFRACLAEGTLNVNADGYAVWFLMAHGGRAEWETLTQYADAQITDGEVGGGFFIWSSLVPYGGDPVSPYAIPALALAVTKGRHLHSMPRRAPTNDGTQLPSFELQTAWKAANRLQKLTGKNFGITDAESGVEEMERNLDKVQAWWEAEGHAKYSFDEIERMVKEGTMTGK